MRRLPDDTSLRYLPSVLDPAEPPFRYMKRRRPDRRDANGHPLGGIALIFPLAIAFALALVLAIFAGLGLTDLLTAETFAVVTDPGGDEMQIVVKRDGQIQMLSPEGGLPVQGVGTLVGSFYRLADGSVVWVPETYGSSGIPASPTPSPTDAPSYPVSTPPAATTTPAATAIPEPTATPDPQSGVTPPAQLLP
jgi:hypothetical protein